MTPSKGVQEQNDDTWKPMDVEEGIKLNRMVQYTSNFMFEVNHNTYTVIISIKHLFFN